MDGAVALLAEARAAGIEFQLRDGRVAMRGSPDGSLGDRLREHRAEIRALLQVEARAECDPDGRVAGAPEGADSSEVHKATDRPPRALSCYACRGTRFWRLLPAGDWICLGCHPPQVGNRPIAWCEVPDRGGRHD